MRLLLDTHTLIWALRSPERLSRAASLSISDRGNKLLVSAASALEIATKSRLGKLGEGEAILQDYSSRLTRLGAESLSITDSDAILAGSMNWAHRDPFDRILAAQALRDDAHFVTADTAFDGLPSLRVLW